MPRFPWLLVFPLLLLSPELVAAADARSEVLVLAPGKKVQFGNPYAGKKWGMSTRGARRRVFMRFTRIVLPAPEDQVEARLSKKAIGIMAKEDAVPAAYDVTASLWVKHQVYRKVGRSLRWVTTGEGEVREKFQLVIDMRDVEVHVPLGEHAKLTAPRNVKFKKVWSSRKSCVTPEYYPASLTFRALQPGKVTIKVTYVIGSRELKQSWKVTVTENANTLKLEGSAPGALELELSRVVDLLELERVQIKEIDEENSRALGQAEAMDDRMRFHASAGGEGKLLLRVEGWKKKKRLWCILRVDLALTGPEPEAPPSGEGQG